MKIEVWENKEKDKPTKGDYATNIAIVISKILRDQCLCDEDFLIEVKK